MDGVRGDESWSGLWSAIQHQQRDIHQLQPEGCFNPSWGASLSERWHHLPRVPGAQRKTNSCFIFLLQQAFVLTWTIKVKSAVSQMMSQMTWSISAPQPGACCEATKTRESELCQILRYTGRLVLSHSAIFLLVLRGWGQRKCSHALFQKEDEDPVPSCCVGEGREGPLWRENKRFMAKQTKLCSWKTLSCSFSGPETDTQSNPEGVGLGPAALCALLPLDLFSQYSWILCFSKDCRSLCWYKLLPFLPPLAQICEDYCVFV